MYYPLAFGAGSMYYTGMVQPKQPPLSIRLGDKRLAEIDAYATKWGLKRHAAILELIDVGLSGRVNVAMSRPTPKPIPDSLAAQRKADQQGTSGGGYACVPLHQPKSFNPQPKKGKTK